jgi:tetratricopeptide (TPR) repeat protein
MAMNSKVVSPKSVSLLNQHIGKVLPLLLAASMTLSLSIENAALAEAPHKVATQVEQNCKQIAALNKAGKRKAAEQLADKLIRENAKENRYRHEKIEILHDQEKYDAALKEIDICLNQDAKDHVAYYWRSDILCHQNKLYEARIAINKCIQCNPRYALGYSLKASYEYQAGNYKLAISYAELALKYDPKSENSWNSIGLAYLGMDEYAKSAKAFESALALNKNSTMLLNNLSMALLYSGRSKEAMEKINLALKIEPRNPYLIQKRAIINQHNGKLKEALDDMNKVIQLRQEPCGEDYSVRASLYVGLKNYDAAISDAKKSLQLKKDYTQAYYNLAHAQYFKGAYKEAIANCTKAIEHDETTSSALKLRGLCYQAIGEDEKALKDFERFTAAYDDSESYKARAQIAAKQGYFEQAADDLSAVMPFSTSMKANPKEYNRLLNLYNRMISSKLAGNETYFDRGMVYFVAGDLKNAANDFEHYLKGSNCKGKNSLSAAIWAVFSYGKLKQDAARKSLLSYIKDTEPAISKSPELMFLRKEITAEKLMETSKDARALSTKGALVGLVLAEEGKTEAASGYLGKVKRMGDQHMDEYFLALKELDRIGGKGKRGRGK